jgi:PGF-CTERM protein
METRRRAFLTAAGSTLLALTGRVGATEHGQSDGTETDQGEDDSEDSQNDQSNETLESVTAAVELLVENMSAGQFDQAYQQFSQQVRQGISPGLLEALWLGLTNVGGEFEEIVDIEETVQGGFDAADATLGFERGEHTLRVVTAEEFALRGVVVNDEYESPAYVDPDSFETREVTLETESCLMEGAITVPDESPAEADGEVPGVVLVHGNDPAGTADMDLENIGSAIFRDLGEGLASQGVAVLRYDRRTNACPTSIEPEEYTLDAVSVDDALLAVERLREADGVDPDRIVVAGLSLGGLALPRIAQRDGNLAGGVAMAAPARSFHETAIDQFEYLATVGEFEWDQMQNLFDRWSERIDRIRQGDYQPGDIVLGYPGALWDSLDEYDQVAIAREIETPLLFLQGGRDYQVTVEDDFTVWQSELADRPATTFQQYDDLNHLFQPGDSPSVQTEYALRNSVDSAAVTDIADWVGDRDPVESDDGSDNGGSDGGGSDNGESDDGDPDDGGSDDSPEDGNTSTDNESSGDGSGPGFGVVGALGGLGGAGYLLSRRLSDESTDES